MKPLWAVLHTHRFGNDLYHFRSETEPTTEQIIASGVDYEEDREDEFIDVYLVHDEEVTEL